MSKNKAIEKILNPTSIAIVGVSRNLDSIGGKPLMNLLNHGYQGDIYLVNPKYEEIKGISCYPTISDIPGKVDLALVLVSQHRTLNVLDECEKNSIKNIVLFGAGFAETGDEGEELQRQIMEKAEKANINILGPNTIGLLNVKKSIPIGFSASFALKDLIVGEVGMVTQSGAWGFSLFTLAQEENIGFSQIIDTGNQMDLSSIDFMKYMIESDETKVVAGYLEEVTDSNEMLELAKLSLKYKKPLLLLKSGSSELGKKAAMSHTASLTGSDRVFKSIAKQYGIITVNDIDDMIDAMKVFSRRKYTKSNKIATMSTSGAAGILMADYSEKLGLDLTELSKDTYESVQDSIPPYGSAMNPIDLTAQIYNEPNIFTDTLKVLVNDSDIAAIIVQTTVGGEFSKQIAEIVVEIDKTTEKPILVTLTGGKEIVGKGTEVLENNKVPVYSTSYKTLLALKRLVDFSSAANKKQNQVNEVNASDYTEFSNENKMSKITTEEKVKELLSSMDIQVPKGSVIQNDDDLNKLMKNVKYPVVCKVISDEILHKTDLNAVKLNVQSNEELEQSYKDLLNTVNKLDLNTNIKGVLVEEYLKKDGIEMFIGIKNDIEFGTVIVCGLGGVFIEVFDDLAIRKAPINMNEANEMLQTLKGYSLLEGVRGDKRKDINALAKSLVKISEFASQNEGIIEEMDINPLLVLDEGEGVLALDGIIIWKED